MMLPKIKCCCSVLALLLVFNFPSVFAQGDFSSNNFQAYQLSAPRVAKAYSDYNARLKAEFHEKHLSYPPEQIVIRAFKAHNELEIWVRNQNTDTFVLFKEYNICALSGVLGPKRWEGDRQVPEGYYFIADFNPKSDFYLSLMLSYPNYSDLLLGNKSNPGGNIYIHGGCVTIGCMPMTNEGIEEIYTLCLAARLNGQINIPVQVFPVRFNKTGLDFLGREYGDDINRQRFWINLKAGYDYFEKTHKILPVMYNQQGKYVF
jgi:murein L,D-transpeptidase YafK